jgi:hypothetical protein
MMNHLDKKEVTYQRSLWVGLSSAGYLVPSFASILILERPSKWLDFSIYVLMAIVSFLSDYLLVESDPRIRSRIHLMDQWTATMAIILNGIKCVLFYRDWYDIMLMVGMTCFAFYLLKRSREAVTQASWVMWHSCWHGWGIVILFFVLYLEDSEIKS